MFAFIPRNVGNKKKNSSNSSATRPSTSLKNLSHLNSSPSRSLINDTKNKGKGKGKGKDFSEPEPERVTTTTPTKSPFSDEDLAILVVLALSDYALWYDGDLRRKIEWNAQKESHVQGEPDACGLESTTDTTGYISLSYLLKHSPHLAPLVDSDEAAISESKILKALKTYAAEYVDVRMVLSGPSWATWGSTSSSTKRGDDGMYEVRKRKPLSAVTPSLSSSEASSEPGTLGLTREYWETRTVYLENIPVNYRIIPGIYKFVCGLLRSAPRSPCSSASASVPSTSTLSSLSSLPSLPLQNITLPPHHLDKPGDRPKCKGFAFVVFSHTQDADAILEAWPWDRKQVSSVNASAFSHTPSSASGLHSEDSNKHGRLDGPKVDINADVFSSDARKFGFRTLSKKRWDGLKEEYLAYRKRLLDELLEYGDATEGLVMNSQEVFTTRTSGENERSAASTSTPKPLKCPSGQTRDVSSGLILTSSSPYPPNCLVFVRNVQTGTNKTTLRALFSKAFAEHSIGSKEEEEEERKERNGSMEGAGEGGLDYVDYNKGMDTCYLRLSTSFHTQRLVEYFTIRQKVVQRNGLDDVGTVSSALFGGDGGGDDNGGVTGSPIELEVVKGRREELYWEKVPERVRRQAVERALSVGSKMMNDTMDEVEGKSKGEAEGEGKCDDNDNDNTMLGSTLVTPALSIHSAYPPDCLLFVRNVHVGTNKTTLRALFSKGLEGEEGGLSYVDYTKGTDTCHLRLSTPQHTHLLVDHFTRHRIAQRNGLDDVGLFVSSDGIGNVEPIVVEVVRGRREELYWEKVPENVRRQAVEKALDGLGLTRVGSEGDREAEAEAGRLGVEHKKRESESGAGSEENVKRKRRRRK